MRNKKSDRSRLFQMALNDVIKSNASKLERNNQCISTKEVAPQAVKPNHEMASKQKNITQLHGSTSPLLCSKDFNKSFKKASWPTSDDIADGHPVSLSINSSNCSSTSKNLISVQNSSTPIYARPISVCEQGTSQIRTGCSNSKWINPPSCNLSTFCNSDKLHGDQSGCDLFPDLLTRTTSCAHLLEEKSVEWPLTNELCSVGCTIPAPKSADDYFNSSSYTNQVNALNFEAAITNSKSCNILSNPFPFDDQIDYQKSKTAIPSPKDSDSISNSLTDVCLTNRKISFPRSKDYKCLSSFETFNSYENSKHSIPSPKNRNFFNSVPFGDPLCLSNSGITIPGPKSYSSFDSCVPLTDKLCSSNSNFYPSQSSTYRSSCSSLKYGGKAQYSGKKFLKSCGFNNCDCNLPSCNVYISDIRDCKNEIEKSITHDNFFSNDYLDELIRMGSKDPDISRNERGTIEDIVKIDSGLLSSKGDPTKSVDKINYEKPSYNLKNTNLIPGTYTCFENPSLEDFEDTFPSQKRTVELDDSNICTYDFEYWMNQLNIGSTVSHSQSHLDQLGVKPKIKSDYYKSDSKLGKTDLPFFENFGVLSSGSTGNFTSNKVASETILTDDFKTFSCFEDKGINVKATNGLLCSYDLADKFSTSQISTSLVDSNLENDTSSVVNITDSMNVNSCISNSTNSINELIASEQNYNSFASDVFLNELKSKSFLECNRSRGRSIENNFSSRLSTGMDSSFEFLSESISNVSFGEGSTCSEPELNAFSFSPKEQTSKVVCLDKAMINADCKTKFAARSTKFSDYGFDRSDYLADDQQRIDNLIDQFIRK